MDQGYIKVYRKTFDHWLWEDEPKSKLEAWLWLIKSANYESKKIVLGSELIEVEPGDVITSEVKLSKEFKWSRTKLRKFLELLEQDAMIERKKDSKKTYLKICNYEKYNQTQKEKKQQKNIKKTAEEHQKNSGETAKKHNEELKSLQALQTSQALEKDIPANPPDVYGFSPDLIKFVKDFQRHIKTEKGKQAPEITQGLIDKGCDTVDKLIRLDKFTIDEIRQALQWGLQDDFYSGQLFSLTSLRKKMTNGNKKFQNLYNQYINNINRPGNQPDLLDQEFDNLRKDNFKNETGNPGARIEIS